MLIFLSMLDTEEERDKFADIYEKYRYFMWYLANEILKDSYLAEDAVQEAFIALTKYIDRIDRIDSTKTKNFVATVVRSKAVDLVRKRKEDTVEEIEEYLSSEAEDSLMTYIEKENQEIITEAIGKLKPIYKVVFEYKYLHDLSDNDIAQLLDVTPKVVNVRIFRARKKLQKLLEEHYICDGSADS